VYFDEFCNMMVPFVRHEACQSQDVIVIDWSLEWAVLAGFAGDVCM
jgi:hypothetical protein